MSKHHPGTVLISFYWNAFWPFVSQIWSCAGVSLELVSGFWSHMDEVRFAHIIITAIGRLCEKCDGKWWVSAHVNDTYLSLIKALYSPVCDSYVRPETLVRICDECNFGTYGGRCIICGSPGASSSNTTLLLFWQSMSNCSGISDAYYCAECTRLEKDRDGCPKIVNLGASRTDLFYERRRLGTYPES